MSELMYNDKEIELIKMTFAENDALLIAVRKLLFGAEISKEEKNMIKKSFSSDEVINVFKKKVYGLNDLSTPVGQLSDFWIGAEKQIAGMDKNTIKQVVQSKARVLDMFERGLELLKNPDGEKVVVTYVPALEDELGINLISRNLYMQAIETALLTVKVIAGSKTESVEETVKRLKKDSSK